MVGPLVVYHIPGILCMCTNYVVKFVGGVVVGKLGPRYGMCEINFQIRYTEQDVAIMLKGLLGGE